MHGFLMVYVSRHPDSNLEAEALMVGMLIFDALPDESPTFSRSTVQASAGGIM